MQLKTFFSPELVAEIGASMKLPRAFVREATRGLEDMELMDRARHVARCLNAHLPSDYERAAQVIIDSLGPELDRTEGFGMAIFRYLPHVLFVAEHGLDHFDVSMRAQHEITRRFSAEFSLGRFVERYPQSTLAVLREWTGDPSVHVRRLVSEGTRPRLPWAPRLRTFEKDPRPVIELLDRLKDDPEDYVRRSVANHLNDTGKTHPALVFETCHVLHHRGEEAHRRLRQQDRRHRLHAVDHEVEWRPSWPSTYSRSIRERRARPRSS
jgi:3-methyladenine DNA glycosylase AlkC